MVAHVYALRLLDDLLDLASTFLGRLIIPFRKEGIGLVGDSGGLDGIEGERGERSVELSLGELLPDTIYRLEYYLYNNI